MKLRFPIISVLFPLLLLAGMFARAQSVAGDSTRMVIFRHGKTGLDGSTRHTLDSLATVLNARPGVWLDAIVQEEAPCFPARRTPYPGFSRVDNLYSYLAAHKADSTARLRFRFDNSRNSDTVLLVMSTRPDPAQAPHPTLRHL